MLVPPSVIAEDTSPIFDPNWVACSKLDRSESPKFAADSAADMVPPLYLSMAEDSLSTLDAASPDLPLRASIAALNASVWPEDDDILSPKERTESAAWS